MNSTARAIAPSGDGIPSIANKFRDDLRTLAGDMEELLKVTAGVTGEQIEKARARAEESLKAAKAGLAKAQESVLVKTRAAARATDEYVRTNPWRLLAIAAGAGVALGYLLGRCSESDS